MALTTRCPQCGTSFKVVPDQLRVRNGLVRCGACATVFDGRACLLPESGGSALPPAAARQTASVMPPAAVAAAPVLQTPVAPVQAAPLPAGPAQPYIAPPAASPPPLSRPSAEPRLIAPWEDEPVAPAPAAPAMPPAVLRGRDDIRRRTDPDADLPEDDPDEEGDDGSDSAPRYAQYPAPSHEPAARWDAPASRRPVPREEPIIAVRGAEPVIDWGARRDDTHAEPSWNADRSERHNEDADTDDDVHERERLNEDEDDSRDHGDRTGRGNRYDQDDEDYEHGDSREPVLGDARTRYSSATDVGRAPPEFLDQDRQERHGLWRKLWGYACLLGLIALGLQLLYAYRTDVANSVPVLRPVLETACKPLGCTVGYARRLERIAISSSSLQPPTGAAAIDDGRTRLVLNLVLRNRFDKPQHWPALVLDLTDLSDTVVVRKVLMPENYLTPDQLKGPFGPAGELKISVPIEVTGVQVNGYQLDKFFP
ncbi:DUF3426 domain-containing protein [Achromobacter seleniivolatilans]|uniref:DUF3426 domain-containing protein n=1 Tax=Achromobacter seleniivolatilans TaxID=3047478 RepID=A0ABY9LV81_9BURK|nr:DUF3426 domain-containing protein [Achromobacter sp. R39]WMD18696.1 DUF3426 domain-containing protein [Achromobacter sp. R39]